MKAAKITLVAVLFTGMAVNQAIAQGFTSGSDGSYGPLNITSNITMNMPSNGIFHCTTITIAKEATLRFNRNPLNTPVYLLATGDVKIDGVIDVGGANSDASIPDGGRGGPGGFDGGKPGFGASTPPGAGLGPGAGKGGVHDRNSVSGAGAGSYGSVADWGNSTNKGAVYGSPLLVPIIGGSGGGGESGSPGRGGGGGGGAILIGSSTRIDISGTGKILALGGGNRSGGDDYPSYLHNCGSGGAIRLVSPAIAGTGELNAFSGNNGWGGHGRIRVDSIVRTGLQFKFTPTSVSSVGSTMLVFPTPLPQLDVIEAAGRTIAVGSDPVYVQLPYNSSTNQTVRVQAKNFGGLVPIRVVLTPDNGAMSSYDATIDNRTANPAETTVNVNMPVNVQVNVQVWTR